MTDIDPELIEGQNAYEDFVVDFLPRWRASFPICRAIKILRERMKGDEGLTAFVSDLEAQAEVLIWQDTHPRASRKKGEHKGQRQGALCRRLLVLSILAAAGTEHGAIGRLLLRHDIDLERWRGWLRSTSVEERNEAKTSGQLPARYGIRSPVPEKLWGAYAFQIGRLSGRHGSS